MWFWTALQFAGRLARGSTHRSSIAIKHTEVLQEFRYQFACICPQPSLII